MIDSTESGNNAVSELDQPSPNGQFTPAVGIIAGTHHFDAALRAIHRARDQEYPVLLACDDPQLGRFVNRYGMETIDIPLETIDRPTLQNRLVEEARARGYPGLIIHENLDTWIDYGRTVESFIEGGQHYSVVAKTTTPGLHDENGLLLAAIPAYNEAKTIAEVVTSTAQVVDTVLVIDDGSDDDTADRAREAGAIVIDHHRNRGYGAAVKTALQAAAEWNADRLVLIDGDGQHDPASIPKLLAIQHAEDAEIVIGSRYVDDTRSNVPTYRRIGLTIINRLVNVGFWVLDGTLRVRDTQSGFRVFNRRAITTLAEDDGIDDGMAASIDILYYADRHGFAIKEIGTEIRYDEAESTHHPVKHGLSIVSHVTKIVEGRRPLLFLGLPGGVVMATALLGVYAFAHGLVPSGVSFPAAVVTAVLVLVGIVALSTFSVLHGLEVYFSRRRFS